MGDWNLSGVIFAGAVGTFCFLAAYFDLRTRKIPNWLTLPMFGLGWVYQLAFFGGAGLLNGAAAFGVGFGMLFLLWMMGSGGGGDVKLLGALSVWCGLRMTILVLIASTLCVLVGTLLIVAGSMCFRGAADTKDKFVADGDKGESTDKRADRRVMPFAAPVALATWVLLILEFPSL